MAVLKVTAAAGARHGAQEQGPRRNLPTPLPRRASAPFGRRGVRPRQGPQRRQMERRRGRPGPAGQARQPIRGGCGARAVLLAGAEDEAASDARLRGCAKEAKGTGGGGNRLDAVGISSPVENHHPEFPVHCMRWVIMLWVLVRGSTTIACSMIVGSQLQKFWEFFSQFSIYRVLHYILNFESRCQ